MKKTVFVGGNIPAELAEVLQEYSEKEDIPVSQILRKALRFFLSQNITKRNK